MTERFLDVLNEIVTEWGKYHDDDGITRIPTDELRAQVLRLRRLDDAMDRPRHPNSQEGKRLEAGE